MFRILFVILLFSSVFCNNYYSYEKIDSTLHAWNDEFGLNSHSSSYYSGFGIVYQLDTLGYSLTDSLPIFAVKLSANADIDQAEPRVLIIGQCHAEEIYGVEIAMEIIDQFLHPENYPNNRPKLQRGLFYTELWVVPTINPEGLRVVHGYLDGNGNEIKDATFRKNKTDVFSHGDSPYGIEGVFDYIPGVGQDIDGVDLNRNFDFNWYFGDSLLTPTFSCNSGYKDDFDYYRGEKPNSESEVQIIMDFARKKNFVLSIAYHSSRSGCIDRYVIYPWAWKDKFGEGNRQFSPGFSVVEKLGIEIAEISGMDIGQNYGHTGSSFRKGNFHDWVYSETGCIQYLVEVGYTPNYNYGAELLIENEHLEKVLEFNMEAFFHLLMRSSGMNIDNALGESTDGNQVAGIVFDSQSMNPIENAIINISGLDNSNLIKPRTTNELGYYCRILNPNDEYVMTVSAYGYESVTYNIEHSTSGPTNKDFQLIPLSKYDIYPSIKSIDGSLINSRLIFKGSFKADTFFTIESNTINLPIDTYEVTVSSPGHVTQLFNLDLVEEDTLSVSLLYENIIYQKNDKNFINDSDSLILPLDFFNSGDSMIIEISLKFELEVDYDFFNGYYINLGDTINFIKLNGGDYHMNEKFIPLVLPANHSNGYLSFILENDDDMNYRGVYIDELKIAKSSEEIMTVQNSLNLSDKISLHQNFPNPFNPSTMINFSVPFYSLVEISIYDINGRFIETIVNKKYSSGTYSIKFNANNYSSGLYFYRLKSGSETQIKQLIIIK